MQVQRPEVFLPQSPGHGLSPVVAQPVLTEAIYNFGVVNDGWVRDVPFLFQMLRMGKGDRRGPLRFDRIDLWPQSLNGLRQFIDITLACGRRFGGAAAQSEGGQDRR